GKDHGKQRPPHLHLACQIDSIHDARKADIRKDHGDLPPANEHCRERGFSAFAFDRIELLVEQLGGEVTQLGVVLTEQNRIAVSVGLAPPPPPKYPAPTPATLPKSTANSCGIGAQATSANSTRSPAAKVSGNCAISSETAVGGRIEVLRQNPPRLMLLI